MGGSGVQRPLKFAKYLREFGWNPIILCPEPGAYQFFDNSLEKELNEIDLDIYRVEGKTPFHILGKQKRSTGLITGSLAKLLRSFSKKIYFPDNKKGWIEPAVKKGKEIIDNTSIDLIFSTAPPFSNHVIANKLSSYSDIPFVVDYRELFSGNHFDAKESTSRITKKLKLESNWLIRSSGVITLDEFAQTQISKIVEEKAINAKVIPHGFDSEDFNNISNPSLEYQEGKFNWLYSGLFYETNQPDIFFKALLIAFKNEPELKEDIHLHFQGGLDSRIESLIRKYDLENKISDYGYVSHQVSVANIMKADILWMISNFSENLKQIKTGKLFEYIGTEKPILGLVYKGQADELLKKYKAGFMASPNNEEEISVVICTLYQLWKKSKLPKASIEFVQQFDRKKLTSELALFFDSILEQKLNSKQ